MPTSLTGTATLDTVTSPNPAEPVRAGAGLGSPVVLAGANVNGGVSYTALVAGVRVRQLGGISGLLQVTVSGNDITVQLDTTNMGVVTSTADQVAVAINGDPAASLLVTAGYTGTGLGLAGVWGYTPVGDSSLGSIRPSLQQLLNRTQYLLEYVGTWGRPQLVYCRNGAAVTIGGLSGLGTLAQVGEVIVTFTAGTANTWYYLYCYGSTPSFELSTTAPTRDLRFKTGDTSRRYVSTVRTDSGGNIVPFAQQAGRYRFIDPLAIASAPTVTNAAWVDLALIAPPHVRVVGLRSFVSTAATAVMYVRPNGSSATAPGTLFKGDANALFEYQDVVCGADQVIQVKLTSAVASVTILCETTGWQE